MRIAQALLLPPDIVHADVLPAGTCDDNTLAVAVNAAAGWGLVSAAAAGNSGDKAKILSPACASKAVAVGAVYSTDATAVGICQGKGIQKDKVTCFSNRWVFSQGQQQDVLGLLCATPVVTVGGSQMHSIRPRKGRPDAMSHSCADVGVVCLDVLDGIPATGSALVHGPQPRSCYGGHTCRCTRGQVLCNAGCRGHSVMNSQQRCGAAG
jgi:hypothetical protein